MIGATTDVLRASHRVLATAALVFTCIALSSGQEGPSARPSRSLVVEGTVFEPVAGAAPSGNAGLFIGVNEFTKDKKLNRLQFAVHDAVEQAYLFVFELKLIPAENCILLLSGEPTAPSVQRHLEQLKAAKAVVSTADRNEILSQLETVRGIGTKAADLLVCSVSSHGFMAEGRPYVMPSDGLKTRLKLTAVALDTVEEDMEQSQAGHRLLFVDACQERIAAKSVGPPTAEQGMDAAFKQAFVSATGQYKLASCSPKQLSYENPALGNVGHGVFTYALLEALRGGAEADGQNFVRLRAVEDFVSKYLASWSAEAKLPAQTPFSAGAMSSRELPLARKAGDLATLAATVRKHPTTTAFSGELRSQLAETLAKLDLRQEPDRVLLTATQGFVSGKVPGDVFVPYLRGELDRRGRLPPRMVRATFLVRDGSAEDSPLASGVRVELQWQETGSTEWKTLGGTTTSAGGQASLELASAVLPTSSGRYYARVSQGSREKIWSLDGFPTSSSWQLHLPRPKPKAGDVVTSPKGMKLAYIPAGEFVMGSDETAANLEAAGIALAGIDISDESPAHRVQISRPLWLGVYEVTKGQFASFVEGTGYETDAERDQQGGWGYDTETKFSKQDRKFNWRNTGWPQSEDHPVVNVSWNDAVRYCNWLSRQEGKTECYRIDGDTVSEVSGIGYRLPREAEWEYACRAGITTRFPTGDRPRSLEGFGNFQDASFERKYPSLDYNKYPSFSFDDRWSFTSPVGEFKPSGWGLYDMQGNVLEWCSDWYDSDYYRKSPAADPTGPSRGSGRVLRGGSWGSSPGSCRSSSRSGVDPAGRSSSLGFRVAAVPSSE
ncbi:MAG: SUMF1/EgtB/PvdO family nonheme iron enzyme [Pirellulales bacterium]